MLRLPQIDQQVGCTRGNPVNGRVVGSRGRATREWRRGRTQALTSCEGIEGHTEPTQASIVQFRQKSFCFAACNAAWWIAYVRTWGFHHGWFGWCRAWPVNIPLVAESNKLLIIQNCWTGISLICITLIQIHLEQSFCPSFLSRFQAWESGARQHGRSISMWATTTSYLLLFFLLHDHPGELIRLVYVRVRRKS
jgi:hypothetical protein